MSRPGEPSEHRSCHEFALTLPSFDNHIIYCLSNGYPGLPDPKKKLALRGWEQHAWERHRCRNHDFACLVFRVAARTSKQQRRHRQQQQKRYRQQQQNIFSLYYIYYLDNDINIIYIYVGYHKSYEYIYISK